MAIHVACIDIGTVTVRLSLASVQDGVVHLDSKVSTICNLGENVDKSRLLSQQACERVEDCVARYMKEIRDNSFKLVCCTMTSAARDAENSSLLIGALREFGLEPQVIPGEVEGRLTLLGVAQDFHSQRIIVADNGGGSTEIAYGALLQNSLSVPFVRSTEAGCRRLTEKFLSRADPPTAEDRSQAHGFAASIFSVVEKDLVGLQEKFGQAARLLVCGGTATSLVALEKSLVPYDSSRVHLQTLSLDTVDRLEGQLASLTCSERACLPGLQPKRAPVILAGTIILSELMEQLNFSAMTVSESDLLIGLSLVSAAVVQGFNSPVGWIPNVAEL
ncbi:MAG: phosphatase [Olegusella sp.]|nr:phosphatase [Olegusella sp.]